MISQLLLSNGIISSRMGLVPDLWLPIERAGEEREKIIWSKIENGRQSYLVLPEGQKPSEEDKGYISINHAKLAWEGFERY
jgi:hypothetical protein